MKSNFLFNIFSTLAAAASVTLALPAQAAIIQVFDPSQLTGGPFTVEDFEDNVFQPGATYTANTGINRLTSSAASSSVTTSGIYGLSTSSFPDPITINFNSPASSVGLWFGNDDKCCTSGFTAYLDIFNANGLIDTISVVANMNDFVDQFLGFNSDELVTSVKIRYGTGSDVGLFHYIDDVYYNVAQTQPVPEPVTTLGLLSISGLALASSRKNKRQTKESI